MAGLQSFLGPKAETIESGTLADNNEMPSFGEGRSESNRNSENCPAADQDKLISGEGHSTVKTAIWRNAMPQIR